MIFFTKFYILPPFFFVFFIIDNHLSFPLISVHLALNEIVKKILGVIVNPDMNRVRVDRGIHQHHGDFHLLCRLDCQQNHGGFRQERLYHADLQYSQQVLPQRVAVNVVVKIAIVPIAAIIAIARKTRFIYFTCILCYVCIAHLWGVRLLMNVQRIV